MMHGYKEFSADVRKIFQDLIGTYSLTPVSENDHMILFKSDKCILLVTTEFTYVEVAFKEHENDQWMVLGPYLNVLYPEARIKFTDASHLKQKDAILSSLKDMNNILTLYGRSFLTGDFSWRNEYDRRV